MIGFGSPAGDASGIPDDKGRGLFPWLWGGESRGRGVPSKGPHTVRTLLSGRAARRASGQRVPVDLESCLRKYPAGRRGARAAARELRRMTRSDVLDLDRAVVLTGRLRNMRESS